MTNDQIEKFVLRTTLDKTTTQINFKSRKSIMGIFVKMPDYEELRSKNFWRIVSGDNIPEYKKSKDINLARIFNGAEMTKLEAVAE
jgi:hypothetical protein